MAIPGLAAVGVTVAVMLDAAAEIGEPGCVGDTQQDALLLGVGDDVGHQRGTVVEYAAHGEVLPSRAAAHPFEDGRGCAARSDAGVGELCHGMISRRCGFETLPVPESLSPATGRAPLFRAASRYKGREWTSTAGGFASAGCGFAARAG